MKTRMTIVRGAVLAAALLTGASVMPGVAGASENGSAGVQQSSTPSACSTVQKNHSALAGKTITIGTDPEEAPFESIDSSGKPVGFDIDLAQEVMACLGTKYTLDQVKFAGLIPALQAGHIQAVMSSIVATPARLKVVNFVGYLRQQEGLLVLKGNPLHLTSINSLCGHSVSVFPGSLELAFVQAEGPVCVKMGKKPPVTAVFDNLVATVQAIIQGRAQVSIFPPPYSVQAEQANPGKLENTPVIPAFNSIVGVAVPKTSKSLETGLYDALKVIQASGDEAKLMKKWGITANLAQPTKKLS
jgi:polar amino acid transport system substrate-binding protein